MPYRIPLRNTIVPNKVKTKNIPSIKHGTQNSIHNGANTHHHDHPITPPNFNATNTIVNIPSKPTSIFIYTS